MVQIRKPKKSLVFLILIGVGMLILSILAALAGRSGADKECQCTKPADAGWRGFSIAWVVLTAVAVPVILKFGLMCSESLLGEAVTVGRPRAAASTSALGGL